VLNSNKKQNSLKGGVVVETEILTDEQYKSISRNLIKAVEGRCRIVPLNSLKKSGYTLNRPIYITVETDGDAFIASLDDVEAFNCADTEFEAINGLCEEIIALYEDLRKNRENLGILPQKWLEYLNEAITVDESS
jgi:type I restriction-modification system DNA methylase subunit